MSLFIPASDARFRYEGRLDWREKNSPVLIWQGSSIEIDFEGRELALRWGAGQGSNFFNLEIDGRGRVLEVNEKIGRLGHGFPLSPGRHRLKLFKRTEAAVGWITFLGIELAEGAGFWAPADDAGRQLAFQFFGDSITAGACNEDGAIDQWENYASHNNALSYAALTAVAFGARYRNVAVSGMGVAIGYTPFVAGQIWNRLYPQPDSPLAREKDWAPDVVFVNYGENDDSFSKNQILPFPEHFSKDYVALVQNVRTAYPASEIVLLRGGMFGGAKSPALRSGWESAVRTLQANDPRVHAFVFQHWSELHPRVNDHRKMAEELTAWLRGQSFIRTFRRPGAAAQ